MRRLFHIWARLKCLQWSDIIRLMCLCSTAFVMGFGMICVDIGTTSLLLKNQGFAGIGFNYLLGALCWAILAYQALILERRRGYGGAWIMFLLALAWGTATSVGMRYFPSGIQNLLFSCKYAIIFLTWICFWNLTARFMQISMGSLKFLGVFSFEFLGVLAGAILARHTPLEVVVPAITGVFAALVVLFKVLGWLLPVPAETFIKKTGGVQDISERVLLDVILLVSFCWAFTRFLVDVTLYDSILEQGQDVKEVLSTLYMWFAGIGLIVAIFVSQTRFLYTMPIGLMLVAIGAGLCGIGSVLGWGTFVIVGTLIFLISSHFYIRRYLSILPVPLAVGRGRRVKRLRWLVMVPGAFILAGSILLTLRMDYVALILMILMFVLFAMMLLSAHLYGRQLLKMCGLRFWRGGQFMLNYAPLKQMIYQGIDKKNPAEVIYFLTILEESRAVGYYNCLLKALRHPAITVRLFALKKINKLSLTKRARHVVKSVMEDDSCEEVRNQALAVLIRSELENRERRAWVEYKEYLTQKEWVMGACIGFLSGRGAWLSQVIEHVHTLAKSNQTKDQLKALLVMQCCPRQDWVQDVSNLLNTTDLSVMKAALSVAGKLANPSLLNRLITLLDEVRWRDHVLETLDGYGKIAFPAIEKMILNDFAPLDRRKVLIGFLGRLPSGEGKQILLRCLFSANRTLRPTIIETLMDAAIVWVHRDRKRVLARGMMQDVTCWHEMKMMKTALEVLNEVKQPSLKNMFEEAFVEEMNRTRMLILDQLDLYWDTPLMKQSIETLKGDDWNAFAGAVSCLQDILPTKLYREVRPVLMYPLENEAPEKMESMSVAHYLNKFILDPFEWTTPWFQALALYGWQKTGDSAGLTAVAEGLKSSNWVVLEAALSALSKLEKNKKKVQEMMLNVPTRYLLKQNLESFVEEKHAHHD
ncbi:MAG: hypothetical protein II942_03995 [Alphaproteobacteria bacterium]|nr:hypothetical protein [Alphaproteobacteria bacterium]